MQGLSSLYVALESTIIILMLRYYPKGPPQTISYSLLLGIIHNPQHYARDFYFFKRAQYPQLSLVHKKPAQTYMDLQRQCFLLKFVEIGKVMLTWGVLKNVNHVVQRVVFLHEDLMKLPSFPRKALEAELDLYVNGDIGKVNTIQGLSKGLSLIQSISFDHLGIDGFGCIA